MKIQYAIKRNICLMQVGDTLVCTRMRSTYRGVVRLLVKTFIKLGFAIIKNHFKKAFK